eukprot:6172928-Pleurochrysis_carterae.AAC.1
MYHKICTYREKVSADHIMRSRSCDARPNAGFGARTVAASRRRCTRQDSHTSSRPPRAPPARSITKGEGPSSGQCS